MRNTPIEQRLANARASNYDRLESLKGRIRQLEDRLRRKKKEFDAARGYTRRIVKGEIKWIVGDLDRLEGEEEIIIGNLQRNSIAQAKYDAGKAAGDNGVTVDDFDDIAIDCQENFDELKVADRAARDLDRIGYQAPQATPVDVDRRMAEIAGETKTTTDLPDGVLKRLKELGIENHDQEPATKET